MLEDLAYAYSETSAVASTVISYIFLVIGGLIGATTNRSQRELARAPYFALTGVILAALSVFGLVEAQFLVPAMANGVLWIVLAAEFAALATAGFAVARIAMARSRDAFGDPGRAFLAFIPVANLWLLFTARPAGRPPVAPGDEHALSGAAGVILGIVLGAGSRLLDPAIAASAERQVAAAAEAGVLDRVFLAELLKGMVANENLPRQVDEVTQLMSMEAGETTLLYTYEVDLGGRPVTEDLRALVLRNGCPIPSLQRVIKAGATVTMTYRQPDGSELASVELSSETCPS